MDIIQRDNKYFLQLANGELELNEQQVKRRVERGDRLHEYLQNLELNTLKIPAKESPTSAHSFITSGKYFDNLIREFEQVYRLSEDKPNAAEKLAKFCRNSITKLQHDRKNPRTDHVVIDYYILSWSRVIAFIQSLTKTPNAEPPVLEQIESVNTPPPKLESIVSDQPVPPEMETPKVEKGNQQRMEGQNLVRQVMIVLLLQADGLFPMNDAFQGVSQNDILKLVSGIIAADKDLIEDTIQQGYSILMKRGMGNLSVQTRIQLLEDLENYFDQLPYPNILTRVKSLLKHYRGQEA
jgi:hypothetical protein